MRLYTTSAYWFTASTSFANPAVTLARCLSNTFARIAPASAPLLIAAQIAGALVATTSSAASSRRRTSSRKGSERVQERSPDCDRGVVFKPPI
jgi:glycerol uptake facilitator-like aquaporin